MNFSEEALLYFFFCLFLVQVALLMLEWKQKKMNNSLLLFLFVGALFFNGYMLWSSPQMVFALDSSILHALTVIGIFFSLALLGVWGIGNFKYVSVLTLYLIPFNTSLT